MGGFGWPVSLEYRGFWACSGNSFVFASWASAQLGCVVHRVAWSLLCELVRQAQQATGSPEAGVRGDRGLSSFGSYRCVRNDRRAKRYEFTGFGAVDVT